MTTCSNLIISAIHMNSIVISYYKSSYYKFQKVYKLIDLGYAKDLEQGSVCTSFVGTMQYLVSSNWFIKPYISRVSQRSKSGQGFASLFGFTRIISGYRRNVWFIDSNQTYYGWIPSYSKDHCSQSTMLQNYFSKHVNLLVQHVILGKDDFTKQ